MPASGPYGKWTKADLADELNISHGYFSQVVLDKGCPKLVPDLIAGRQYLFCDDTAEQWLAAYRAWRAAEPERKAERRAAIAAHQKATMEADLKRITSEQFLLKEGQAATERFVVEREEWEADQRAIAARMPGAK